MIDFLIKIGLGTVGFLTTALIALATIGVWAYGLVTLLRGL